MAILCLILIFSVKCSAVFQPRWTIYLQWMMKKHESSPWAPIVVNAFLPHPSDLQIALDTSNFLPDVIDLDRSTVAVPLYYIQTSTAFQLVIWRRLSFPSDFFSGKMEEHQSTLQGVSVELVALLCFSVPSLCAATIDLYITVCDPRRKYHCNYT